MNLTRNTFLFLTPLQAALHRGLLKLVGKNTIDEFRNGKFPRLKPGVASVGFCSEGASGVKAPVGGGQGRREWTGGVGGRE